MLLREPVNGRVIVSSSQHLHSRYVLVTIMAGCLAIISLLLTCTSLPKVRVATIYEIVYDDFLR